MLTNDTFRNRSRACRANSRSRPSASSAAGAEGSRSATFALPAWSAAKNAVCSVSVSTASRDFSPYGAPSMIVEKKLSNAGVSYTVSIPVCAVASPGVSRCPSQCSRRESAGRMNRISRFARFPGMSTRIVSGCVTPVR